MSGAAPQTTLTPLPVQPLLEQLNARLEGLGLRVSLWNPSGTPLIWPCGEDEFCRQMCGDRSSSEAPKEDWSFRKLCMDRIGDLAQRVCLEDRAAIARTPSNCCLVAVPIRRRRRAAGAVVACWPTFQTPDGEEFARACSQASLDADLMTMLCKRAARHDAREAETLCQVVEWLIQDEQAKQVARDEVDTLSNNLANTYEELSLLYRISGSMKVTQSTTQFFDNICNELLEGMQLQAAVAVLGPREGGPKPHMPEGEESEADREQVFFAGALPLTAEQMAQIAKHYLYPRLGGSPRAIIENQFANQAGHLGAAASEIRTLIAVPLTSAERYKGMLVGINKGSGEFDSVDLKLISSISSQAAMFLENHHLYEDLQDLLMGMLHALTASIDAKDPHTCGHSRRVALLSRRLAQMCGFEERRVERVYLAGLLHDIGKIGMREAVLGKVGRLTEAEYAEVKRHPEVGAGILRGIAQIDDLIPVILHHHERLDGRGYPHGLAGRQIPIEALIVGLADSFDAMTSYRPYRTAMPLEAVITEIRRCSGTQFDSHLVELLLSLDLEPYLCELRQSADQEAVAARSR